MTFLSRFTQVDLSQLASPPVIEPLDYETIRQEMLDVLATVAPELAAALALESEPLVKVIEIAAYRELTLRARVNDAAKACMLAFATGTNLDHLAALFGVERLVIDPGDEDAVPPVAPVLEKDVDLRARTQLALEGFTTAGTEGAYIFHARAAHGQVKDVSVTSPNPSEVVVSVLSTEGDGTPSQEVLDAVTTRLDLTRPLASRLTVRAATIVAVPIEASLELQTGPDTSLILATAEASLVAYLDRQNRVGLDITRAGIIAALWTEGVQNIDLTGPSADVAIDTLSAAHSPTISLAIGGSNG